jgi:hypothetical protein
MGIEIRSPDEAKVAAKTGAIIGKAQQRAMEWEMQKAEMRSQLDFQNELRLKQIDFERFARAKEWDLEKMQLRSQMDFQEEERERLQKKQEYQAIIKQIDESTHILPDKREAFKFDVSMRFLGVPNANQYLRGQEEQYGVTPWFESPEYKDTPLGIAAREKALGATGVFRMRQEEAKQGAPTVPTAKPDPFNLRDAVTEAEQISTIITPEQSQGAKDIVGRVLVESPEGKQEAIDLKSWPTYKEKGYKYIRELYTPKKQSETSARSYSGGYGGFVP